MLLKVDNIRVDYGKKTVLEHLSFELQQQEVLCILGANGVGKTTLYNAILGFKKIKEGSIFLEGTAIENLNRKEFAKQVAYVPQFSNTFFSFKVIDVVVMGRNPYMKQFEEPSKEDYDIAIKALEVLGIEKLSHHDFTQLSGGERQLVLIARALTQQPKLMIMDEPTSSLDFGNAIKLLSQIIQLKKENMGILITSHSPQQTAAYATKVLMIKDGKVFKYGAPSDVISNDSIYELYNINTQTIHEPELKRLLNFGNVSLGN